MLALLHEIACVIYCPIRLNLEAQEAAKKPVEEILGVTSLIAEFYIRILIVSQYTMIIVYRKISMHKWSISVAIVTSYNQLRICVQLVLFVLPTS